MVALTPLTVTLGDLLAAEPALARLTKREVPLQLAFKLSRLHRAVRAETLAFEQLRLGLVKKYGGDPRPDGWVTVRPEHLAEFTRQVNDAAQERVQLHVEPLSGRVLTELAPDLQLPAQDLVELGPLFVPEA